jgi:hypothetical protein
MPGTHIKAHITPKIQSKVVGTAEYPRYVVTALPMPNPKITMVFNALQGVTLTDGGLGVTAVNAAGGLVGLQ